MQHGRKAKLASAWSVTGWVLFDPAGPRPDPDKCRYAAWQQETCPISKRVHWQCYVELVHNGGVAAAQKALGLTNHCHAEPARDPLALRDYCLKQDKPGAHQGTAAEFGVFSGCKQGKRTDLDALCKLGLTEGLEEIKRQAPGAYVRYYKGLEKLIPQRPNIRFKPEVWVVWGDTGLGKSEVWKRFVEASGCSVFRKNHSGWWDGYAGQDLCVLEDFDPSSDSWLSGGLFKTLFDEGTDFVAGKGQSHTQFLSKWVVITSNFDPKSWFPREKWETISRRIKYLLHSTTLGDHADVLVEKHGPPKAPPVLAPSAREGVGLSVDDMQTALEALGLAPPHIGVLPSHQ